MASEYRILKLKSGEEIIAKIVGQDKDRMVIQRPYLFKTSTMMDPLGRQREITVLRNWLKHTNQIQFKVPKDHIAMFLEPDADATHLYELEKEREDVNYRPRKVGPAEELFDHIMNNPKEDDGNSESLEEMIDRLVNTDEQKDIDEKMKKMLDSIQNGMDSVDNMQQEPADMMDGFEERDFVVMNMMFPASIIQDMIRRGILSENDLKNMADAADQDIEEMRPNNLDNGEGFTDEYTGHETNREDYGTRWTDWSWELEDYLDEEDQSDEEK